MAKLSSQQVGLWPMNTYLIVCENTLSCAIVDPGAEPDKILESVRDYDVKMILITHGHPDHIGALDKIRDDTDALIYIHPSDGELFHIIYDQPYENDGLITLGELTLKTIHTPGHTPGSTCIDLGDNRIIVGDTIFVGGPGKTLNPSEFELTMTTMKSIFSIWSDETIFYPGHGYNGLIRDERIKFESFISNGWPEGLYGDVTWDNF